jgi:predicted NUDIX family NTP pyrophosphohydrolase
MKENVAAGLLMCRLSAGMLEFFLVHPGGPFYKSRDTGVWSIPKGLPENGEDLLTTAQREFFEETGISASPPFHALGSIQQKGGKVVHAWTFKGNWDPASGIQCNTFSMEWPPHSGKQAEFPEIDSAKWMTFSQAAEMILPAQLPLVERATNIYQLN